MDALVWIEKLIKEKGKIFPDPTVATNLKTEMDEQYKKLMKWEKIKNIKNTVSISQVKNKDKNSWAAEIPSPTVLDNAKKTIATVEENILKRVISAHANALEGRDGKYNKDKIPVNAIWYRIGCKDAICSESVPDALLRLYKNKPINRLDSKKWTEDLAEEMFGSECFKTVKWEDYVGALQEIAATEAAEAAPKVVSDKSGAKPNRSHSKHIIRRRTTHVKHKKTGRREMPEFNQFVLKF